MALWRKLPPLLKWFVGLTIAIVLLVAAGTVLYRPDLRAQAQNTGFTLASQGSHHVSGNQMANDQRWTKVGQPVIVLTDDGSGKKSWMIDRAEYGKSGVWGQFDCSPTKADATNFSAFLNSAKAVRIAVLSGRLNPKPGSAGANGPQTASGDGAVCTMSHKVT